MGLTKRDRMTPQEEKEQLLKVVVRVAAIQLKEGGLVPFGATLGFSRNVKLLMPKGWAPSPTTPGQLEGYGIRELRLATAAGACKTVCYCADVRVPVEQKLVPAIFIHIEHAEGSAEDILSPYRKDQGSDVVFGEPTSAETEHQIFTPSREPS
jgi:hypothetical protein